MDHLRRKPFKIPQVDGGGYDNDEDYAGAEEISSSSESESSVESESESASDGEVEKTTSKNKNNPKASSISTKQNQRDLLPRRVTRQQGKNTKVSKNKPVIVVTKGKVGRPRRGQEKKVVVAAVVETPRTLRNLVTKSNDVEKNDENSKFLCKNCKKGFPTKTSLGSHSHWCNPLRVTRSRTGDVPRRGRPSSNNTAQKNKVTTKPKQAQTNVQQAYQPEDDQYQVPPSGSSQYAEEECINKCIDSSETLIAEDVILKPNTQWDSTDESDYETMLSLQPVESEQTLNVSEEPNIDNSPATCPKCQMNYRNLESLQKHINICTYTSSSCSSEEDEDDEKNVQEKLQIIEDRTQVNSDSLRQPAPRIFDNNFIAEDAISNIDSSQEMSPEKVFSMSLNAVATTRHFYPQSVLNQHPISKPNKTFSCPADHHQFIFQESLSSNIPSISTGYTLTEANNSVVTKLTEAIKYPELSNSTFLRTSLPNTAVTNTVNSVPIQSYGFSSYNNEISESLVQPQQPAQINAQLLPWNNANHQTGIQTLSEPQSTTSSSSLQPYRISALPEIIQPSSISMLSSSTVPAQHNTYSSGYQGPPNFPLQYNNGTRSFIDPNNKGNGLALPAQTIQQVSTPSQIDQQQSYLRRYSQGLVGSCLNPNEVIGRQAQQQPSQVFAGQNEMSINNHQFSEPYTLQRQQQLQQDLITSVRQNSLIMPSTGNQLSQVYQPPQLTPNILSPSCSSQQQARVQQPNANNTQVVYYQDPTNGSICKVIIPIPTQGSSYPSLASSIPQHGLESGNNSHSVQHMLPLPQLQVQQTQQPSPTIFHHQHQQSHLTQQQHLAYRRQQEQLIQNPLLQHQPSASQHPQQILHHQVQMPEDQSQIQISHQPSSMEHHQLTGLQESQQMQLSQHQLQAAMLRQQSQIPIQHYQNQQELKNHAQISQIHLQQQQQHAAMQKNSQEYNNIQRNVNEISMNPFSKQQQCQQNLEQNVISGLPNTSGSILNNSQPYQMIQTADGTTYYIVVQPGNSSNILAMNNVNRPASNECVFNSAQQHQQQIGSNLVNSTIQYGTPSSLQNVISKCSLSEAHINLSGNTDQNIACTLNSSQAQPCPCARCSLRVVANTVADKYRKVLPSPRPIEPKLQPGEVRPLEMDSTTGFVKTLMKRNLNSNVKSVKSQLASMIKEKHCMSLNTASTIQSEIEGDMSLIPTTNHSESTSQQVSRKNPVLTAVVRPMEHPLQKMSDQISQIESSFNAASSLVPTNVAPLPVGQISMVDTLVPARKDSPVTTTILSQDSAGVPVSIDNCMPTVETNQNSLTARDEERTIIDKPTPTTPTRSVKRKSETFPENSPAKSIKVTLVRKKDEDAYAIKEISETVEISDKKMINVKIKGKITTGKQSGTSTDVLVEPRIHIVPIPDPDSDDLNPDSNLTIVEDSPLVGPVIQIPLGENDGDNFNPKMRLTHRAVVVYEVIDNGTVLFRSSDVRAVWSHVFETVQGTRWNYNLPPLSYPATNISLSENQQERSTTFSMVGLTHRALQFLMSNIPQSKSEAEKHKFKFLEPPTPANDDDDVKINESGCARVEGYGGRKPFDMFGWLASKHRKPLETIQTSEEGSKNNNGVSIALRYRNLKEKTEKTLMVLWSTIHGRGLYTRRAIEKGEMIIEYAGEVIRSLVCDQREKYYETKAIGCYMFRINDECVIDATMKGNAARFINHSCDPNCNCKLTRISGKDHILIFALRKISSGEELTYDYKFDKEEVKIPCSCASKKCRKYLN